jgi:rod shape-determining protein MreB
VDIEGGATDIAVISLLGIVYSHSVRLAGNATDEAIVDQVKCQYNLVIGERPVDSIKIELRIGPSGSDRRGAVAFRCARGAQDSMTSRY